MNFVAGAIIYNLESGKYENANYSFGKKNLNYEELTFWILIYIYQDLNWRGIYVNDFSKLNSLIEALENHIKLEFKEFYQTLEENEIGLNELFMGSITTIFLYKIPLEITKIILDMFLLERENLIFEIILRMLKLNKSKIYNLKSGEEILNYFSNIFFQSTFKEYEENLKIIIPFPLIENII